MPHVDKRDYEPAKQQALELWLAGHTYREIAQQQNVSPGGAHKRVQAAMDDMRPHADYDRYRATQLAELDTARMPLRRIITTPNTPISDLCTAITTLLRLQEREAKLLGLDRVPTPIDDLTAMTDDQLYELVEQWRHDLTRP